MIDTSHRTSYEPRRLMRLLFAATWLALTMLTVSHAGAEQAADASLEAPTRRDSFIGANFFPVTTDETFGAGFAAGWSQKWYALVMRENFMQSATRSSGPGTLERLRRRVSFELTAEGQLRHDRFTFYAGLGPALRAERWERISLAEQTTERSSRWLLRPTLSLGLVDDFVDLGANLFLDSGTLAVRFGIGISSAR